MQRHVLVAAAGFFFFVTASVLLSQEVRPERERERERVRERIEMVRMWKMTDALDLSKDQGDRLFPRLSEIDEKRRNVFEERDRLMRELADTVRGEHPDEAVVKNLLARLEHVRDALDKVDEEEMDTVKGVLSTIQQARYAVFKENFDRELRMIIRDVRDKPSDARNERSPRSGESPGR